MALSVSHRSTREGGRKRAIPEDGHGCPTLSGRLGRCEGVGEVGLHAREVVKAVGSEEGGEGGGADEEESCAGKVDLCGWGGVGWRGGIV